MTGGCFAACVGVADDASPEVLESMEDDPNIHDKEC